MPLRCYAIRLPLIAQCNPVKKLPRFNRGNETHRVVVLNAESVVRHLADPALASGLLLLLAGFLLATAALLTALPGFLFLLAGLLTAATLLAALAWILISHDLSFPAGEFPPRTTSVP